MSCLQDLVAVVRFMPALFVSSMTHNCSGTALSKWTGSVTDIFDMLVLGTAQVMFIR